MSNSNFERTAAPLGKTPGGDAAAGIAEGLDLLVDERHPYGNVVRAFRELLVERAQFKSELKGCDVISLKAPDPFRFERGVPLSSVENILDMIDDRLWIAGARRLIPVMAKSFPKIREDCEIIGNMLFRSYLDPRAVMKAFLAGGEGEDWLLEYFAGIDPRTLSFALCQIAKPLIENISRNLSPLVNDLFWGKGYCPICGSMPELAFMQDDGEKRWLRCAACSHEWRFTLVMCPSCENENQEDFEIYYMAEREYESVDVCHKCRRYLPTIDMRKRPKPIAREVAALALIHLDAIARQNGFFPADGCGWNIVNERDIFSTPVHI